MDSLKNTDISKLKKYLTNQIRVRTPLPNLWRFEVHIADHCNLKCKYCTHYSNIAKPHFTPIDEFESDFKRISELTKGKVNIVTILGGEPLLNKEICDYLDIARHYFSKSKIQLTTNGILLEKMDDSFWNNLKKNEIVLRPTVYPIKINWKYVEEKCKTNNIKLQYQKEATHVYKIPIRLDGACNPVDNWCNCLFANNCIFLKKGRLYTCTQAANIDTFNDYYQTEIPNSEENSIDIYKANNIQEILEFLSKPIPFCSHCNFAAKKDGLEWERGKPTLEEWMY